MKISMDYFSESNADLAEMLMAPVSEFSFAGPDDEEETEEEEESSEGESEEEPALDPDIVHSPVTPQTGGKPE